MRQAFLVALSFANICYLRVWSEVLTYRRWDTYLMATPPKPVEYYALIADVLLAALLLTALTILAQRVLTGRSFRFAEMALVAAVAIPLNAIRGVLAGQFPYLKSPLVQLLGMRGVIALGAILTIAGLMIVIFYHHRAARILVTVFAALSPFCIVTFGQAIWKASKYDETAYHNNPPAARLPVAANSKRVVWVIADEWDYRLTFVDRDPTLSLPQIDRLRATSLSADEAHAPGEETPISIPGYYDGKLVNYVLHDGPRELSVRFHREAAEVPWSKQPSVFDRARAAGANTALLEWYHPTCRVLNNLTYCKWWPMAMQHNSMGEGLAQIMFNQTRSLFETNVLSLFGRPLTAVQHAQVYHQIMADAKQVLSDPAYGFVIIHLPVPHAPHTYDRKTRTFTLGNKPYTGYIDSLALLDDTVGELRAVMENAGTWDSSAVLFTSDHPYRDAAQIDGKMDGRIPYLLKLPGQKEGVNYTPGFNTVFSGELLVDIMRGEVRDPAAAAAWLDRSRARPLRDDDIAARRATPASTK